MKKGPAGRPLPVPVLWQHLGKGAPRYLST